MTSTRALRGPFDYRLPEELRGDVGVGSMLVVPFGRQRLLGVVTGLSERSEVSDEKLLAPLHALELGVPAELVMLAQWVAAEYCSTLARALSLVLPPAATRRLSALKRRPQPARPLVNVQVGARSPHPPALTAEQSDAVSQIGDALNGGFQMRLLAGITGSGKTEVYLRAAARALEQDRGAIVLVPEIALTPQIVSRFSERLGDTVAVLHSRLTLAQRREQWRRLRMGQARVCVGPRSAVFAPIERLGLVVVDEEHDASYKHEGDPRYDARAVAEQRARQCSALLLLGSATPRPESVRATQPTGRPQSAQAQSRALNCGGASGLLRLTHRVDGRSLPSVQVLDMCNQPHRLHPLTAQALSQVRAERSKAIVLLNRRGWSNFLSCRSCGRVWSCPHCDVALVLHRARGFLACHHCGHSESASHRCECGSTSVARHGSGTERVQHELSLALDDGSFPVFRLDADTAEREPGADGGVGALLSRFERAPCGVLIGTQMVAKGHDFLDVTLGVVLDADSTLRFPDFRAEERTFALLAQLAGRVGRGSEGRVLVQTIAPQARSIVHAAAHDSDGFLAGELERRAALSYPPFSSLVRIVCSAEKSAHAHAAASALRAQLSGVDAAVLGPAALFRLRGRERHALVLKAPPSSRAAVVGRVDATVQALASAREHTSVSFSVDVDPQ
jgi:primosomal protein N' (replication factor Y) (superfamily II helicase)